jgi:hypothetical protein
MANRVLLQVVNEVVDGEVVGDGRAEVRLTGADELTATVVLPAEAPTLRARAGRSDRLSAPPSA